MKLTGYAPFVTLQEKNTPFYVATVGNPKKQTVVHRPFGIEDYQILYTVKGKGNCFLFGNTYELKPQSLLYLPPGIPHEYSICGDEWETLYITFNGTGMNGFFSLDPVVCSLPSEFNFIERYNKIYNYKKKPHLFRKLSIELYSLLLDLKEYLSFNSKASGGKNQLAILAMHYITENQNEGLDKISKKLGVSTEHLCRVFKNYTGYRPVEYVNMLKIQQARYLLKSTSMPINDIAAEVGYESHSYFSKLFKKYTGASPIQYRNE